MDTDAGQNKSSRTYAGPAVIITFDGGLHKIGFGCYNTSNQLVYAFGRAS